MHFSVSKPREKKQRRPGNEAEASLYSPKLVSNSGYMLSVNVNMNIPQHYSPAHQSQNKKRPITTTKHQPREISADYGQIYNLGYLVNQCMKEEIKEKLVQNSPYLQPWITRVTC